MTANEPEPIIRTRPCPRCLLCDTDGTPLYQNLRDRLFGTPGTWSLVRCPSPACGLVWLDPQPVEEDIALAYRDYFTHQESPEPLTPRGGLGLIYRGLLASTGLGRQRRQRAALYLGDQPPGKLLEVGCGAGRQLAEMRRRGWEVAGQEIDAAAAERARQQGLRIHVGPLANQQLPAAMFDAIALSHVIEHVHDPVGLLAECRRLLKPGGGLVVVTPNIDGLGHRRFGVAWRDLDPPRHLHLFSPRTLPALFAKAGCRNGRCWTTAAQAVGSALASLNIRRSGRHRMDAPPAWDTKLAAVAYQLRAALAHHWQPGSGDECVMKAWR